MIRQLEKQNSVSLSVISASNNDNNYTNTKLGAVFTAYKWYDVTDSCYATQRVGSMGHGL